MESKLSRIGVVARIRPILNEEIKKGLMNTLIEADSSSNSVS
jgi:hypothetical protein